MAMILVQASNGCGQYMHIRPRELYPSLIMMNWEAAEINPEAATPQSTDWLN